MSDILKAACIQFTAKFDVSENMKTIEVMIREAASNGATFIVTPENTDRLGGDPALKLQSAYRQDDHPFIPLIATLAKELQVWILIGSFGIKVSDEKMANRQFLFSPTGAIVTTYNKLHLFDVDLPNGDKYRESDLFIGGEALATAALDKFTLGLSICYDVRFAYLYRALAKQGANILAIPAAFTVPTGQAHWDVLMRARAIETGSFVIAAAQTGEHDGGRKTYGHSIIVGPWGEVLAQAGTEVGIIYADLNLQDVAKARSAIPALQHDRSIVMALA